MKHQYESEILFHLMERDGFNIPSSVPPYESEIKAYLINQVKLAYPKLTDYEAEWLLYNYTKHLPADFPISSATNVTEATFENVVPFAYQSAILKGNTKYRDIDTGDILDTFDETKNLELVSVKMSTLKPVGKNLFNINGKFIETRTTYSISGNSLIVTGEWYVRQDIDLKPNTAYTLSYEKAESANGYTKISVYANNLSVSLGTSNTNEITFTTPSSFNNISVVFYAEEGRSTNTVTYTNIQLEKGSVATPYEAYKMLVLTTTGKNLFDKMSLVKGVTLSATTGEEALNDKRFTSGFIFVKNMKNITISLTSSITAKNVWGYDANKNATNKILASGFSNKQTITIPDNIYYIRIPFGHVDDVIITDDIISNINIQIEEGLTDTLYEPYKTNILSTSEEVELRGIGDVQDTLDCLTGELTQRIGEVVLDGTEDWTYEPTYTNDNVYGCYITLRQLSQPPKPSNFNFANNVFPNITNSSFQSEGFATNQSTLSLRIAKNKLESANLSGFKKYLQNHPVTLQYPLATESIKTVDLKTVNESGESVYFMPLEGTMHVQSSGEPIQPTFDMSVPVEATTQNLASFIDLEMEE